MIIVMKLELDRKTDVTGLAYMDIHPRDNVIRTRWHASADVNISVNKSSRFTFVTALTVNDCCVHSKLCLSTNVTGKDVLLRE